jgi:sugar phosphate isomerase/epimerase
MTALNANDINDRKFVQLVTRRAFIGAGATTALAALSLPMLASAAKARFKVGVTDWNLKLDGKIESISLAKRLGFDGVQIGIGRGKDKLPLSDPALQKAFLDESKRVGLKIESLCLDILHRNCLKSDPLGQRWVADSIPIAKAMGVRVVLLPFFGKCAMETSAEMDKVGDVLKEVAPAAEKAGVILGLEDTLSARDNVRIMDRTQSSAVLTYYDVGNSTNYGFDAVKEIRWLGRARICEVHLKDNPHYLGEGSIDFRAVIDALADVGFEGWAQLETDSPVSVEADMRRNLKFIRGLIAARNAA